MGVHRERRHIKVGIDIGASSRAEVKLVVRKHSRMSFAASWLLLSLDDGACHSTAQLASWLGCE
jgi:hypothetical protein